MTKVKANVPKRITIFSKMLTRGRRESRWLVCKEIACTVRRAIESSFSAEESVCVRKMYQMQITYSPKKSWVGQNIWYCPNAFSEASKHQRTDTTIITRVYMYVFKRKKKIATRSGPGMARANETAHHRKKKKKTTFQYTHVCYWKSKCRSRAENDALKKSCDVRHLLHTSACRPRRLYMRLRRSSR